MYFLYGCFLYIINSLYYIQKYKLNLLLSLVFFCIIYFLNYLVFYLKIIMKKWIYAHLIFHLLVNTSKWILYLNI